MSGEVTAQKLVGHWIIDPEDHTSLARYGKVSLTFTDDGRLVYSIWNDGRAQAMLLTYYVSDGMIVTDQPSLPRKESTAVELTADGKLVLRYEDHSATYVRVYSDPSWSALGWR
jgi:hypothetical protein